MYFILLLFIQDFYMKNFRCLSILCNKCKTANDIDYNFCKNCGISKNQANRSDQNIGLQDNNRDNISLILIPGLSI